MLPSASSRDMEKGLVEQDPPRFTVVRPVVRVVRVGHLG
ncbi:MAG: hypothetical protein JWO57_1383 [Pseudonocardiales bacterium]|nr:hypothetical protein [Pseudonocardiales bacterium]